jgi:signal transduction histidine kinase
MLEPALVAPSEPLRDVNERLILSALQAHDAQASAERAFAQQELHLAVVAHELRNPLAPITYALKLMDLRSDDAMSVRTAKAIIARQVTALSRLITDLLDVSRAASGKLHLERVPTDLVALIGLVIQGVRPTLEQRQQQLDVCLPDAVVMVDGDAVRLTQVFGNLLDNASKYTPKGGRVDISLALDEACVTVGIRDTGIGISPDQLLHVFDAFVQEDRAIQFNGHGLGIGLAVVRQLVHAHGGSVEARSVGAGQGSEFVVRLNRI